MMIRTLVMVGAMATLTLATAARANADDLDVDGIDDALDDCPAVWDPLQADCNADGVGDACNDDGAAGADADQDGVCDAADNCPAIANVDQGNCNGGVGDLCEAAWANRDDDRDGVCNGSDACPREAGGTCGMQAITVPWVPANPTIPHPTYSGATHTLKGIARYGGTQYRWDFGDGSAATAWTAIANPYNLGVNHVYTGAVGQIFIATLSVRDAAGNVVTAIYRLKILDSGPLPATAPYAMDPARMDVRIDMAIDQGLWWLHINLTRGTYVDSAPGWAQPYGNWSNNLPGTCTALDAFELHGSKPSKDYASDPYVETAQRALNYILASHTSANAISAQTHGQPDYNRNGIGLRFGGDDTYTNGICGVAVASSGTPNRQALVGTSPYVLGRTYKAIAQDMAEWFAFGQVDSGTYRGGWHYGANYSTADGSTNQWPMLAIAAAEDNMAITTPAFVRSEAPYFMAYTRHAALDNRNGGWGYMSSTDYVNHVKTAAGILYHDFMGDSMAHQEVQAALGFLYRYWSLNNYDGGGSWNIGLGNSYAMYGIMKAMRMPEPDILRIVQYDYDGGVQTGNSFDWYYTPPGQTQEGLATNLVRRQTAAGSWSDSIGANAQSGAFATGWDVLILQKGVTIIPPQAMICDCTLTWDNDQDVTLDGSCSTHPDLNRHIVSWEWDFFYDGTFEAGATGQHGTLVGGYGTYGSHPVALLVTDDNPLALGGPQTSLATCNIVTKPPNNCPHPSANGPYLGTHGVPVQLDATGSFDPDGDDLQYAWDLDNDGIYDDAFGATPLWTWTAEGTYGIAVQVTDVRPPDPITGPCTRVAYSTVEIGNHAPVADPDGPYTARPGQTIMLDGTGSYDPDGDPITFAWDLDNDGVFTDSSSPIPAFAVPAGALVGTVYDVCLRVVDSADRPSETSCTTVTVQELNTPPACTQPTPAIVAACTGGDVTVTVDGSESQDADGDPLSFAWTTTCPGATFADPGAAMTTLTMTSGGACSATCTATLTVSDGQESTSCDRIVDVIDTSAPLFSQTAPDLVLECDAGTADAIAGWLTGPSAFDECTSGTMASDFTAVANGCGGATGWVSVTWTATDSCGNAAQDAADLFIVDTVPPAVTCPAPASVECTGPSTTVLLQATADDVCFGALPVEGPASGDYLVGTTWVTFGAQDSCGNAASCMTTVEVTDTTPPSITCPADVVVECDAQGQATGVDAGAASAADLCGEVVVSDPPIGSWPLGASAATHSATDESGNTASCTNQITVQDTTAPVFDPATLGERTVLGNCSGDAVTFTLPAATDVCQTATVTCEPVAGTSVGANSVTCTATDESGNATTATIVVNVLAPLRLAFHQPLSDDNVADDPASDADAINLFKVGSTIPHQLFVYSCSGENVTAAVAGQVTLRLTVTYRSGGGGGEVSILPEYSGVGDAGGVLVFNGTFFKYNLNTNRTDYPAGTASTMAYFDSLITATWNVAPAIVAAREDARLESR